MMETKTGILLALTLAVLLGVASVAAYGYIMVGQEMHGYPASPVGVGPMTNGRYQGSYGEYVNTAPPRYYPGYSGMGGMGHGMMGRGMGMMGGYGMTDQYGVHCGGGYGNYTSAQLGQVAIMHYTFVPNTITVPKGITVTWINMDWVAHSVESGTHENPTDLFDSGLLQHAQTFSYTFNEFGTYTYHCDPHPYMTGTVIVTG